MTGTEDETTDFEGDGEVVFNVDGGEAMKMEEPKLATPMGLAGAEEQPE